MPKVIGIDPGLAETGIGLVEGSRSGIKRFSSGCIRTKKRLSTAERLAYIYDRIYTFLSEERPDLVVVEDAYSLKVYPKSGILLGKVTGVILLAACKNDAPIMDVPVREAKQVLTGNGNASKSQLEAAVRRIVKAENKIVPDHASDAVALALIGLFRFKNR